jgi:periplasmic copper chaperone A
VVGRAPLVRLVLAGVIAAVVSAGCGDAPSSLEVTGAWARSTGPAATTGAAYFTITSPVDDRLLSVSVSQTVARTAGLHQTMTTGGDDMAGMGGTSGGPSGGADDMTTMRPLAHVDLPAGKPVVFEPGARHVMLSTLAAPLQPGHDFDLVLRLQHQGRRTVHVRITDGPP